MPELARPVGACLVVFTGWVVLERTVLTQAPAPSSPAAGTPAPQVPPGGGRAGDGGRGGGRGELSPFAKTALAALRAPLDRLTPVTEAMLRNPPAGDWLHWRRTYDGWAHSPLTQINRDTVKDLTVAWTWSLNSGTAAVNEFTPLVRYRWGNPGLQGNAALRTAPEHGAVRGASSSMLWVWQLP